MKFTGARYYEWLSEPDERPLDRDASGKPGAAPLPALWERVRAIFGRLIDKFGKPGQMARRTVLSRQRIAEINWWLRPLESLANGLVLAAAAEFLRTTEEGRKLWLRGPTMEMPQAKSASTQDIRRSIPHPGWQTIAQPLRETPEEGATEEPACDDSQPHAHSPATWHCPVHGPRWLMPDDLENEEEDRPARGGPMAMLIEEYDPLEQAWRDKQRADAEKRRLARLGATRSAAYRIAFRMEALSRLLADPTPHILQTARFLARIPREAIVPGEIYSPRRTRLWRHGHDVRRALFHHIERELEALLKPPEPERLPEPG